MGFRNQVTVWIGVLMLVTFFWTRTPRHWRARLVTIWGIVLALVLGNHHLNMARHLGAPDLHKEEALPPVVSRPGIAGQRIGPLRIHLAVPPEVQLETRTNDEVSTPVFDIQKSAFPVSWTTVRPATKEWTVRAAMIPILVVLENDSYQPISGDSLGWKGSHLCSVRAERLGEGGNKEVFRMDVPIPDGGFRLTAAERRSIEINWPISDAPAGDYKVFVELPFGEHPVIEIPTRLY